MTTEEITIPKWVRIEEGSTDRFARFAVEPFERGYGTTVGNSMRRVLLASLGGAAVTAIRIEGQKHEFSAIPGVEEDMTDVILNFKSCDLAIKDDTSVIFSFTHKGAGEVTAGEIFSVHMQGQLINRFVTGEHQVAQVSAVNCPCFCGGHVRGWWSQ